LIEKLDPNVFTPTGGLGKPLSGPSPEDVYVQVYSGVLSVPIKKRDNATVRTTFSAPSEPVSKFESYHEETQFSQNDSSLVREREPNATTPSDGYSGKGFSNPSAEDLCVQVSSGVSSVPYKKIYGPAIRTTLSAPTRAASKYRSNLVSPKSVSMAKASPGRSSGVYVQVQSGLLQVPLPRRSRLKTASKSKGKKTQTVPFSGSSMSTAVSGPSPEDVFVQVASGVLSLPIRRKTDSSKQAKVSDSEESMHSPRETESLKGLFGTYTQIAPELTSYPTKRDIRPAGPKPKYSRSLLGPSDVTLPNPSGIIALPHSKPTTTIQEEN
jgi:hypothetical protein